MTNEEFQQFVVEHLVKLSSGQDELRQNLARLEHEHGEKLSSLFDAREVQNDVNERIINTLERIEAKVDVLQLETASIRRIK